MGEYRKLLCFGSRDWTDRAVIERELKLELDEAKRAGLTLIVIHGACRGADNLSGSTAWNLGIHECRVPASWALGGPTAGPLRNDVMVNALRPDCAIGFHADIENSKGSKDCYAKLKSAGVPTRIVTS